MPNINTFSEAFKAMSPEDKDALRKLQDEESKRLGVPISLGDIIRAVTPDLPTPAIFKQ